MEIQQKWFAKLVKMTSEMRKNVHSLHLLFFVIQYFFLNLNPEELVNHFTVSLT